MIRWIPARILLLAGVFFAAFTVIASAAV